MKRASLREILCMWFKKTGVDFKMIYTKELGFFFTQAIYNLGHTLGEYR